MTLRPATSADIPAILELLKASLGEVSSPKTEAYWRWKHIDNPFGPSPVMLAEEEGKLVGVRAFMRWEWQEGGTVYRTLRAVDTATHPDYQGRGIFKKLTLALRAQCADEGDHFIYNTPNDQSRPGYLKMGWQSLGRVPVRITPGWRMPGKVLDWPQQPLTNTINRWQGKDISDSGWATMKTKLFLQWRYADCPIVQYHGWLDEDEGWLMIGYPKDTTRGTEWRITEWLPDHSLSVQAMRRMLRAGKATLRPTYISISPFVAPAINRRLSLLGFTPAIPLGPVVTYYSLQESMPPKPPVSHFHYTLGDLELF